MATRASDAPSVRADTDLTLGGNLAQKINTTAMCAGAKTVSRSLYCKVLTEFQETKGVIKQQLRFPLPESSQQVVSNIITMGQPSKPTHSQKPDTTDIGISQVVAGGFDTTNTKPSKLELDENKDCEKICMTARRSTVKKEDAYVQEGCQIFEFYVTFQIEFA